jgi:phosphoribosylanthranilate isomerase
MVEKCGLDLVQLHGSEGMEAANSKHFGVPALRVVDIELGSDGSEDRTSMDTAASILKEVTSDPIALLLDTSIKGDKHGGGGTGQTFDWTIAESIQNMGLPVIIAGGLTPENIGEAVGNVRPWGVDVAGGVEAGPGVKDIDKLQKFIGGAKKAAVEASKGF